MDSEKFNNMIVQRTAEQLDMKPAFVRKVVRQYYESIKKLVGQVDFENITPEEYKKLYRRSFYIPNLGTFVMNWKIIEAYQNKQKRIKQNNKDDQN